MKRSIAVVVLVLVASVVGPVVADAKKKPSKPKGPAVGQEKCEQAVTEHNGPIEAAEVAATRGCFKMLVDGLETTSVPAGGIAHGCPSAPGATNQQAAKELSSVAKGWQTQLDATKKAKAGYFKREAVWYENNGPRAKRGANVNRVNAVVRAIGMAGLDISGYYVEMEAEASAVRSNDCGGAQTHYQGLVKKINEVASKVEVLNQALTKLP